MARKGGLGKGLDALLPENLNNGSAAGINYIPTSKIKTNPHQPREQFFENDLTELADSIKEHGILQPLIVTSDPLKDEYTLIAGERRLRAAIKAGFDAVPVIIRQASELQRLELALIENLQRTDLSPLETAEAYKNLLEDFGLTQNEISHKVGKNRTTVANTLRLLNLPDEIKTALRTNSISEGHARAMLSIPNHQEQIQCLQMIIQRHLSVRQTEDVVKQLIDAPSKGDAFSIELTPELRAVEEQLRSYFGTKVTIKAGRNGGTVAIHYYSDEELNLLLSKIIGR